jgi:beta-phosphoglucomutase-like phosphatase (HAD superfamily)
VCHWIEVAVDGLGEERIDDVVFLLLRDEDVDVELRPQARNALHQLERRHLQLLLRAGAVLGKRIERVVHQHGLQVAVGLDRGDRLLRGGDAAEGNAEGVVEGARRGVQPLHELAQDEVLVVDDQNAAGGLGH